MQGPGPTSHAVCRTFSRLLLVVAGAKDLAVGPFDSRLADNPGTHFQVVLARRVIRARHHNRCAREVGFLADEAESALRHIFAFGDFSSTLVVTNQDG